MDPIELLSRARKRTRRRYIYTIRAVVAIALAMSAVALGWFGLRRLASARPDKETAGQLPATEPVAKGQQRSLTFDGDAYLLAWVEKKETIVLNEYLRKGESLENWTYMVTVSGYPKAAKAADLVGACMVLTRDASYERRPPQVLERKAASPGDDTILISLLVAPDKSYDEFNIHRFVKEPNEPCVKSYQFSMRVRAGSRRASADAISRNRSKWIDMIGNMSQPVYEDRAQ